MSISEILLKQLVVLCYTFQLAKTKYIAHPKISFPSQNSITISIPLTNSAYNSISTEPFISSFNEGERNSCKTCTENKTLKKGTHFQIVKIQIKRYRMLSNGLSRFWFLKVFHSKHDNNFKICAACNCTASKHS